MVQYKVVSFNAQLKGGAFSTQGERVDTQVEKVINDHAAQGWTFVSYQAVHAHVKPGCLAGLFGRKEELLSQDVLIFSRQ